MKIICIFGTRPEAIKMCPLLIKIGECTEIQCIVCLTGQHKEMLDQVMGIFGIKANYNLDIMQPKQSLSMITIEILKKVEMILDVEQPDMVMVHGDTTTSLAASLAAFYKKIPVAHVEAGLRTYDKYSPFPEEVNRSLIGHIASIHFAPTVENKLNLYKENITKNVYVTGNTVIDALQLTVKRDYMFSSEELRRINIQNKRCILITAHRRENWGEPLKQICEAVKELVKLFEDIVFIYPVHLNPIVHDEVFSILSKVEHVYLISPINVEDMHNLIARSYLVMTDSGGIQEEAPAFGVPVLVLRSETERPEAVNAGTIKIVGVSKAKIIEEVRLVLTDSKEYEKMAHAINPYGDGRACERIVEILKKYGEERL